MERFVKSVQEIPSSVFSNLPFLGANWKIHLPPGEGLIKKAPLRVLFLCLFFDNIAVVKDKAAVHHKDVGAFKINIISDEIRKKIAGIDYGDF